MAYKHNAFSEVSMLAKKYLSLQATSVPSERVFSAGGEREGGGITDPGTCLTTEHAEE